MSQNIEYGKYKHIRQLWPLIRPYKLQMTGALVAIGIAASTMMVFGWGLKNLIDEGFADASGTYLNRALLVLLGIIALLAAASFTRFYLVHWMAERAIADLRKNIYRHLLSLDPSYFETRRTGEQVSRINTDTTVLQMVITTHLPMALRHMLTALGGIAMLFVVSPKMTGMVLCVVPVVMAPIIYFGRRVRAKSRETQNRVGDLGSFSHETLQGLQTLQSFGYETTAFKKFAGLADETFATALKYVRLRAALTAFVIFTVFSVIGVVLWMGGHEVLTGTLSAGALSAFVFYAAITAGAVGALSESATAFNQAAGAADRIIELLLQQPAVRGSYVTAKMPQDIRGDIAFDHVSFSYPTRLDQKALDKISFAVRPGEVVALAGPSGGGKTTIFQLLQRFYDPSEGIITIDGLNTADYNPRDVRSIISVVSQEPAIFSISIADNIRMGRPDATDTEVQEAATLARAHDFIKDLPQGYNTRVGERGSRLSGGQKQRIAIARALLKNPKILLMDEATAALDSANEQGVMLAMKQLMQGRTTIVIAHRLSTIQSADRIILLDQGRIVAEGTHDALADGDSLYSHLTGLQLQAKSA